MPSCCPLRTSSRTRSGDGSPWMLGDFLWIVDPSNERWLRHLAGQLASARTAVGFDGFHLDQYGAPKRAVSGTGATVDLAEAFPVLIERLRAELPAATLVFNNVNDFPTWATAGTSQDAVYIEVWSPHDRLDHLGALAAKARLLAPGKPVSLAADLLFDALDVTGTHLGGVNTEVRVEGAVWARALEAPAGRVVSLIDLTDQS